MAVIIAVRCRGELHKIEDGAPRGAITPLHCTWEQVRAEWLARKLGGPPLQGCARLIEQNLIHYRQFAARPGHRLLCHKPRSLGVRERAWWAVERVMTLHPSHALPVDSLLRHASLPAVRRALMQHPEPLYVWGLVDGEGVPAWAVKLLDQGVVRVVKSTLPFCVAPHPHVAHGSYLVRQREGGRWWLV